MNTCDSRRPCRTAPRPPRRCSPIAVSTCPCSPRRSPSSARATPSTATTPPTSRCSSPRRPASTPASSPAGSPRRSTAADGIASAEVAGPGFLNIRLAADAQGAIVAQVLAAGAAYGTGDDARRQQDQPRVRLGQPDRPGPPRRHPLGRGRRRARPDARRAGRRRSPASTTSTTPAPRSTGSPGRCWPRRTGEPAPEDGYGGAYIAEIAAEVLAAAPGRAGPARRRARRGLPRRSGSS